MSSMVLKGDPAKVASLINGIVSLGGTVSKLLRGWAGEYVVVYDPGMAGGDFLLSENGDKILLESGDNIILE